MKIPATPNCNRIVIMRDKQTKRVIFYCTTHKIRMQRCENCGAWFHSRRQHATSCSDRCRKANERRRKNLPERKRDTERSN